MPSTNLCQPIFFSGSLKANDSEALLTFKAHINPFGNMVFDFDTIAVTTTNSFIQDHLWTIDNFSLSGKAEDGTKLFIDSFGLNDSEVDLDQNIISLKVSRCPEASFIRKLEKPNQSILRWLKGFRNDTARPLMQQCQLGTIVMYECHFDDSDEISGVIKIESNEEQLDFATWHDRANNLLDHVMGVMRFATGKMFKTSIIENYTGNELEVIVVSQTGVNSVSNIPVCSYIDRQSIFKAAVASFFEPPFPVNNLLSTVEWFVMDSSIYEVRLIHVFTALENLVASNLESSENGKLLISVNQFKKLQKTLKKTIKDWIIDNNIMPDEDRGKIYAKLNDLNRRSLEEKLRILARQWSVLLQGIDDDKIKAAIRARNSIVHEGRYNETDSKVKMEHLWVIREIVIRFILTAIGYKGSYLSHLGGFQTLPFPPQNL